MPHPDLYFFFNEPTDGIQNIGSSSGDRSVLDTWSFCVIAAHVAAETQAPQYKPF